ncbi:MAG TPA: M23 family metallopeptidase [Bacillota bacterium]
MTFVVTGFLVVAGLSKGAQAGFAGSLDSPVVAGLNAAYLYAEADQYGWGHTGADFECASGSNVSAAGAGTVEFSGAALNVENSGTARGGASNYIVLATTASAVDGAYFNRVVYITGGTGNHQSRVITSYEGATRKAFVGASWSPIPDTTSTYDVGTYRSYGEHIIINHSTGYYYTLYAHMQSRAVFSGWVSSGQYLGLSDDTGNSSGAHLHFEVRRGANAVNYVRNPESWLARSNQSPYGALRGLVTDASGITLCQVRVAGASKPTDYRYGASYSYALNLYGGQQFGDVSEYGINYYIGRAPSGSVTLTYTAAGKTAQTVSATVDSGLDKLLTTVMMP